MIDLYDLLVHFGLPQRRRVKMYRHVDPAGTTIRQIINDGEIDLFQAVQSSRQLGDDIVLFFAGESGRMSRFINARQILEIQSFDTAIGSDFEISRQRGYAGPGSVWHQFDKLECLDVLAGRLTIEWPREGRHHLWLLGDASSPNRVRQVPVYSLRPVGFDELFPGYSKVRLSHADLCRLDQEGDGDNGWITALSSARGAYLITDLNSGDLYVGSATGEESIWGRWRQYARTIHGNNKILKQRVREDVEFARRLQFTILETVSNLASRKDGLEVESRWKLKLGRKAVTLNDN